MSGPPTKGRFRGEEIDLEDAPMELTREELDEVEATRDDGSVFHPFREHDPKTGRDSDGILSI